MKRAYDSNAGEVRRYALNAARAELARLLELFPELRQEIAGQPAVIDAAQMAGARIVLKHWRKTAKPKPASNGHRAAGPSLAALMRQVLTNTPQSIPELTARAQELGYQHSGKAPIGNRVAQAVYGLKVSGEAKKTPRGWTAKGAPAK